ncbi:unnamed protein product, partial [Allacma fusca]
MKFLVESLLYSMYFFGIISTEGHSKEIIFARKAQNKILGSIKDCFLHVITILPDIREDLNIVVLSRVKNENSCLIDAVNLVNYTLTPVRSVSSSVVSSSRFLNCFVQYYELPHTRTQINEKSHISSIPEIANIFHENPDYMIISNFLENQEQSISKDFLGLRTSAKVIFFNQGSCWYLCMHCLILNGKDVISKVLLPLELCSLQTFDSFDINLSKNLQGAPFHLNHMGKMESCRLLKSKDLYNVKCALVLLFQKINITTIIFEDKFNLLAKPLGYSMGTVITNLRG